MDRSAFKDLVNRIEVEYPVHAIQYKGEAIWPLLRLLIYKQFLGNYKTAYSALPKNKWVAMVLLFLLFCISYIIDKTLGSRLKKNSDFYILFHPNNSLTKLNGKIVHRFFNPLKEIKYKDGKLNLVHLIDYRSLFKTLMLKHKFVGKSHLFNKAKFISFAKKHTVKAEYLTNFSYVEILNEVLSLIPDNQISVLDIADRMESIITLSEYFKKVLDLAKPANVYHICFYEERPMAVAIACNKLAIPMIEIQHGQGGLDHPMYNNWKAMPENGYSMLPTNFWVWGMPSARLLLEWANHNPYKVFISGNLWMTFFAKNYVESKENKSSLIQKIAGFKKVVFVASNKFISIPEFVLNAINTKEGSNYFWILRLHPGIKNYKELTLKYSILFQNRNNIDFELNTKVNSLELILLSSIHITTGSSVAIESQALGKNVIVVTEYGQRAFEKQLSNAVFLFASNQKELFSLMESNEFKNDDEPFMCLDEGLIINPKQVETS